MLISSLLLGAGLAAAAPLQQRWSFPEGHCVTDIKVELCTDFDCQLNGYKRIDAFLNQAEDVTRWNYLFYKTEQHISEGCITQIHVAEENEAGPEGDDWSMVPHSVHEGITEGGGPTIWKRRQAEAQYAGQVVDLVILKGGRWKNKTEDYIRSPVNLGLGAAAGAVEYETFREGNAVSSGWLHLDYTVAGARKPITQVKVLACPEDSIGPECGVDLIKQGWERRDVDLNGPTANGSHIYLFTSTEPTAVGDCIGRLALVNSTELYEDETIDVNVNEGTTGAEQYVRVVRSQDRVEGSCLTSIIPLDLGYFTPKAHYEPVRSEEGAPANFNEGVQGADPVFVYTSSITGNEKKDDIKLFFNETGQFKIALYSDLHYGNQDLECRDVPDLIAQNCTSRFTYRFMSRTLDQVQPDLVIVNGDVFADGPRAADGQTYEMQTAGAIIKAVEPIVERGLPFAMTWGNHDPEGDLTREEIQRILGTQPGFVGSRGVPELEGIGNYHLDIATSHDGHDSAHKLWFLNSGSYLFHPTNGTAAGPYGKVGQKQIDWYKANAGGNNGLAFFHIPLGEIALQGTKGETICPQGQSCTDEPDLDDPFVGLFEAFLEKGEVKAAFSGHGELTRLGAQLTLDHVNDYTIDVQGITLGYDGSAGYNAYGAGDINYNRQMRVIDIANWGQSAETYKIIDDLAEGTVHRNGSEPILKLF